MKRLSWLLLALALACSDSSGPSNTGPNFAVRNRGSEPATVVLHHADWDTIAAVWTERPDTAYLLTVQPGVCTDVVLDLAAVSGAVTVADSTLTLSVFWLAATNTWTATVFVESGPDVIRSTRSRGAGCTP